MALLDITSGCENLKLHLSFTYRIAVLGDG